MMHDRDFYVLFLFRAPGGKGKKRWMVEETFSHSSKAKLAFNAWVNAARETDGDYNPEGNQQIIKIRANDNTLTKAINNKEAELNSQSKKPAQVSTGLFSKVRKPKPSDTVRFTLFDIKAGKQIATSPDFAALTEIAALEFAKEWGLPNLPAGNRYYLQWDKIVLRDRQYTRIVDDQSGTYRIVTNKI